MKKITTIIIIGLMILIGFILLNKGNNSDISMEQLVDENSTTNQQNEDKAQIENERMCYQTLYSDGSKRTITLTLHENKVIGTDNWIPMEKDSNIATFTGIVINETLFVMAETTGEGMTNTEERFYKFNPTEISAGYASEGLSLQDDGIYRYSTDSSIEYSETFPRVDCADLI